MAIFAIIGQPSADPQLLSTAIATEFPADNLPLQDRVWLVAFHGTPVDLSNKLGITDGQNGAAIVLSVGNYYGRTNPTIWDWIKEKWEATGG